MKHGQSIRIRVNVFDLIYITENTKANLHRAIQNIRKHFFTWLDNLDFHISLQKVLILDTYMNILLFFGLYIFVNIFFLICHTKWTGKKNNYTIIFFSGPFSDKLGKNIYEDVQTERK
jgi:hypothetical protein